MSEFYKLRRSRISDALAMIGFLGGLLIPAYDAAQSLVTGFENPGQEAQGLKAFVIRILLNAFLGGAAGLVIGLIVGWIWERLHRTQRTTSADDSADQSGKSIHGSKAESVVRSTTGFASGAAALSEQANDSYTRPDAHIRFDEVDIAASEFLTLAHKVMPGEYDADRTHSALQNTINIGAWDGDRLVGVVRILSDGYLFATIPEIVVDPSYRRRGIGRELMMRALDRSGTGVVLFGSPPESAGFFERLGCQRAPSGYVLRRKKAATVTVR